MEQENRTPRQPYQPPQPQQPQQPQYQPQPPYLQPPFQQPQYPYPFPYPQYPPYAPQPPKKKTAAWKVVVPVAAGVLALAILACVYFFFLRPTPVAQLSLSETELCLQPGELYELSFTYAPADADAFDSVWTSSDPSVAVVKNGSVTAVGAGECVVTLHAGDEAQADCRVRVEAPGPDGADIVGTWRFDGAYFRDAYYDVDEVDAKLYVYADHTASLVIDGEKTKLTWTYSGSEDGTDCYEVHDEADAVCQFQYDSDPDSEFYGDLTLYGDWENMIFFTR